MTQLNVLTAYVFEYISNSWYPVIFVFGVWTAVEEVFSVDRGVTTPLSDGSNDENKAADLGTRK